MKHILIAFLWGWRVLFLVFLNCSTVYLHALSDLVLWHIPGHQFLHDRTLIEQANQAYAQGVQAKTYTEKENAFNEALSLYSKAEALAAPFSSPELNVAIGNTYFVLNAYPQALLYYHRALKLTPFDTALKGQMNLVRQTLGLDPLQEKGLFSLMFNWFFQQIFWKTFFFSFIGCIIASIMGHKKTSRLCGAISLFFLSGALLSYYAAPLEGIMISSSGLYKEPNVEGEQANTSPLLAGSEIELLESLEEGNWVKIQADSFGYVPASTIRSF